MGKVQHRDRGRNEQGPAVFRTAQTPTLAGCQFRLQAANKLSPTLDQEELTTAQTTLTKPEDEVTIVLP